MTNKITLSKKVRMTRLALKSLAAVALCGVLAACPAGGADPIVADWEGDRVGGQEHSLTVDDDLEGEAEIFFFFLDELVFATFDVEVDVLTEGERYELLMTCDGCRELDFEMSCRMKSDGDKMVCDGSDLFSEFDFEWRL